MPTILTLGHADYLLPDSVNLNTLLKALQGAKQVRPDYRGALGYTYTIEREAVNLEVKVVRKDQVREGKKPKQISAQASPDCDGPML